MAPLVGWRRLENLRSCIWRILEDEVPGDLLEAGTWRGGAAIYMRAALEAYADVVNNPTFPADELEPMKQRVIAGIQSQDADWTTQAFRYFKQQYFGPSNSPYQFLTIGTADNVKAFTREQLQQWYKDKVLTSRA